MMILAGGTGQSGEKHSGAGCAEVEENGNVLGGAGVRERQLFRTECNGISLLTKKRARHRTGIKSNIFMVYYLCSTS